MSNPSILTIDIETSPNLAHVWALFDQTVSLSQLRETTKVISFAAKWRGEKKVEFRSDFHDGHDEMIQRAHTLLDEADVVVHFNGARFDMPHLRREFIQAGFPPHSPVKEVDLLKVVKSRFKFVSNKLQHVSTELGLDGKVQHSGHDLWVRCMAGDAKAWATMRKYNIGDTRLTEELYDRLIPWVPNHPHVGLYTGEDCCQRCGSTSLQKRGSAYTPLGVYQQLRCNGCGSWSRGKKSLETVDARGTQ